MIYDLSTRLVCWENFKTIRSYYLSQFLLHAADTEEITYQNILIEFRIQAY